MLKLKQKGFSLFELMIAVGVAGVASLGVMQMTQDQVKIQKSVETEFTMDTLIGVTQKLMINTDVCGTSFGAQPITVTNIGDTTKIDNILNINGDVMINGNGGDFGDLRITSIDFVYRGEVGDLAPGGGAITHKKIIGDIEITAQRKSTLLSQNTLVRRLPFPVELSVDVTTNNVEKCSPTESLDITQDSVEAFCNMITHGLGTVEGTPPACNLNLTGTENPGNLVVTTGPDNAETRALSLETLQAQIGMIKDPSDAANTNLFTNPVGGTDGQNIAATFVKTTGGVAQGTVQFNGGLEVSGILTNSGVDANTVVNEEYLNNNLDKASSCAGGGMAIAGADTRKCLSFCQSDEFAKGIKGIAGQNLGQLECFKVAEGLPNCANNEGSLKVNSNNSVTYECCSTGTLSSWSTCSSTCGGTQTRSCSCGTCGGAALTQSCGTAAVDASWGSWGVWSTCTAGSRYRDAQCEGANSCGSTTCPGTAPRDTDNTCGTPPPSSTTYSCDKTNGQWTSIGSCTDPDSSLCTAGSATDGQTACCSSTPSASTCTVAALGPCDSSANCKGVGDTATCNAKATSNCESYANNCACSFDFQAGCFVAGTQIKQPGSKYSAIEDLLVGDIVVNVEGKAEKIVAVMKKKYEGRIYSINGSDYFFTPNHPLLTTQGWKSLQPGISMIESGIDVGLLKVGDVLVREDGFEEISRLEYIEGSRYVYNIEVNSHHEYVANGFGVHNKYVCGGGTGCAGYAPTGVICSEVMNGTGSRVCGVEAATDPSLPNRRKCICAGGP